MQDTESLVWEPTDLLFLNTNFNEIPLLDDSILIKDEKACTFLSTALVKGNITEDQKCYFQMKFNLLLEAYNAKRQNVQKICKQIRMFYNTLKEHKIIEKSFNSLPETVLKVEDEGAKTREKKDKSQVCAVNIVDQRLKLLSFQNQLLSYDANYKVLSDKMKYLTKEKTWLQNECHKNKLHSQLENKLHVMREENTQLETDMTYFKVTVDYLKKKLKKLDENVKAKEKECEHKQNLIESLKHELKEKVFETSKERYMLEKLIKQFDSKVADIQQHESQEQTLRSDLNAIYLDIGHHTSACVRAERLHRRENGKRTLRCREHVKIEQHLATIKQKITVQQNVKSQLSTLLHEANIKRHLAIDKLQITYKEKDKMAREIILTNNKWQEARTMLQEMQTQHDIMKQLLQRFQEENRKLIEQRQHLLEDVNSLKRDVLHKGLFSAAEAKSVEKNAQEMYERQTKLLSCQKCLQDKQVDTKILITERQKQASACLRLVTQLHQLQSELKVLTIRKENAAKYLQDDLHRIEDVQHMCDTERNERNKDYQQMLATQQKLVEWRERLKVLKAEKSNLKRLRSQRASQHRRVVDQLHKSEAERDALSTELNALSHQMKEQDLELETAQELKVRAQHVMTLCQHEGNQLCESYDVVVDERNHRGLQVRDRLEEAVIFTEKLETFSAMLERADREMRQRDEVSDRLAVVHRAESHHVQLLHKRIDGQRYQLDCLAVLCTELELVTRQEVRFEHYFNTGTRQRISQQRQDHEKDSFKLRNKFIILERRVLQKEAHLIELQLVHEQVQRITEKLQQDSKIWLHEGHLATKTQLAVQDNAEVSSRQMKALISELALVKASSQRLKRDLEARREELEEAKQRMKRGEAPTVAAKREWAAMERRRRDLTRSSHSPSPLPCPSPRPTAYIPNQQVHRALPLPRPYGALAPFKPSPPAHKLRFYHTGQKDK